MLQTLQGPSARIPHPPLRRFFHELPEKQQFVRKVFDNGAGSYDRIEQWMALGSGRWYRREALTVAGLRPGMRVLDVAVGTGLVAREAAEVVGHAPDGRPLVTGLDPSRGMLCEASRSLHPATAGRGADLPPVRLLRARAEHLPFPTDSFDFLSMGYALRHVADLSAAFNQFFRVLKPGGLVCVLEMSRPQHAWRRVLLRAYMKGLIPCLSRIATPERENRAGTTLLWRYYWETIEACVEPDAVLEALRDAGFVDVSRRLRLGIFSDFVARKPAG